MCVRINEYTYVYVSCIQGTNMFMCMYPNTQVNEAIQSLQYRVHILSRWTRVYVFTRQRLHKLPIVRVHQAVHCDVHDSCINAYV